MTRESNIRSRCIVVSLALLLAVAALNTVAPGIARASSTTTTTYPQTVTYKATLVDVQYVQGGRCYWGVGPEWSPYTPTHGGVVGGYSLTWTNGAVEYEPYENSAQKIGSKLFIAFTGGGGPAPCGPPDPHQGGRFPSLVVTVTANLLYPVTTTTVPQHSITGTISYLYASGESFAHGNSGPTQTTPARETEIEILAATKSSCSKTIVGEVYTDDNGEYSSTLSSTQEYVCLKVIAATSYSEVIPYPGTTAEQAADSAQLQGKADASKPLGPVRLKKSTPTTYSWTPSAVDTPIDEALDINNAIVTGASWVSAYGLTPKFVNILYPYPSGAGGETTNFSPKNIVGEINQDDAFDWGVLLHEYGHAVGAFLGIDNTTPVRTNDHDLPWNMTNHEANKAQGIAIAWNEGFADFFSQMVQDAMGASTLGLTDVGGSPPNYVDYTPSGTTSFLLDVPGDAGPHPSLGEDSEVSVARVLWSIYKQPAYAGVAGSVAFVKTLVGAMGSNSARTLYGAVSALLAASKSTPWVPGSGIEAVNEPVPTNFNEDAAATTYGTILSSQNVAPTITASGFADKKITLSWSGGQPSTATIKLNAFLIQFFNSSWTTLLGEQLSVVPTGTTASGAELYHSTTDVPSSWGTGTVHVVVLGWNGDVTTSELFTQRPSLRTGTYPVTGPYISAPVSLKLG